MAGTALPIRASASTEKPPLCSQSVSFSCLLARQGVCSDVEKIYTECAEFPGSDRRENAPRRPVRIAAA